MYRSQGTTRRAYLGLVLFIGWLLVNAVTLPWMFEWPLMVMMLSLFPLVLLMGYLADSFAGERERGTLESLLLSPVPDWAIVCGKLSALVFVSLFACGVLLTAHAIIARIVGGGVTPHWYALALYVNAIISTIAASLGLIVSWSAASVQAAQQLFAYCIIGLGIITVMYMYLPTAVGQVLGRLDLAALTVVGAIIASGSLIIVIRAFHRDRLLLR